MLVTLNEPLQVPALVRVALGLLVTFGGALFILGGSVFILNFDRPAVLIVGMGFVALGAAFVCVGYRLFVMGKAGRSLLSPLGLRIACYVAAFLSAFAVFGALISAEYLMGLSALGGAFFSFLLYKASKRPGQGMPPDNPRQPTPEVGAAERTR